jgi:hypothetical protein
VEKGPTAAAKETATKSTSTRSTPAKTAPAKTATKTTSTGSTGTRTGSVKGGTPAPTTKTGAGATKSTSARATPTKTAASKPTSARTGTTPTKTAPAAPKSAPANAAPAKATPTKATPAKAAPAKAASTRTSTARTTTSRTATARSARADPSAASAKAAPTRSASGKFTSAKAAGGKGTPAAPPTATEAVTAEQPRTAVPPEAATRISPPTQYETPGGRSPGFDTPPALAAATAAAHEAAAIAAVEAELRRTGGSVTQTRGPSAGTRPTFGTGLRPPTEPRTPGGTEFRSANAAAAHDGLHPGVHEGVIEGTVAGEDLPRVHTSKQMLQRRRRIALLVFLALAVIVLLLGQFMRKDDDRSSGVIIAPAASALLNGQQPDVGVGAAEVTAPATAKGVAAAAGAAAAAQDPADTADTAPTRAPAGLAADFTFVDGWGPVLGSTGTLRRFKVAVEKGVGQGDGSDFADEVDRILGDPRSWIAGRQFRLQRVPHAAASEFTIYLSSANTSARMCAQGGLKTDGYTSCRLPGQVIINLDRWEDSVPKYKAPLTTYRAYTVNHEVGHQLGHGHEACPGEGQPAPVMMQQTYGLNGCIANAWPYIDGRRYAGMPIA